MKTGACSMLVDPAKIGPLSVVEARSDHRNRLPYLCFACSVLVLVFLLVYNCTTLLITQKNKDFLVNKEFETDSLII